MDEGRKKKRKKGGRMKMCNGSLFKKLQSLIVSLWLHHSLFLSLLSLSFSLFLFSLSFFCFESEWKIFLVEQEAGGVRMKQKRRETIKTMVSLDYNQHYLDSSSAQHLLSLSLSLIELWDFNEFEVSSSREERQREEKERERKFSAWLELEKLKIRKKTTFNTFQTSPITFSLFYFQLLSLPHHFHFHTSERERERIKKISVVPSMRKEED